MTGVLAGYLFALVAAVARACVDAARKRASDVGPIPVVVWFTLMQAPAFLLWIALDPVPFRVAYLGAGVAALVLNIAANLLFVRAVEVSPLSRTVPFLALGPVFTTVLGVPLLDEFPEPPQLAGIGLVVVGAFLLNADKTSGLGFGSLIRSLRREPGSVMMIGVAGLFSLSLIVDKIALKYTSKAVHALVQTGGVGMLLLLFTAWRGRLGELRSGRRRLPVLVLAAVAATIATAFQLLALEQLLAALVETLKRAVGLISALALGRVLFGETIRPVQILAVLLMIGGTVLLVV